MTQLMTCPHGHRVPPDQLRYEGNTVICPVCYPQRAPAGPERIAGPWRVVLATAVLVGFVMVVIAFVLAFARLPKQTFDGAAAWCGPGETSRSAVSVRMNPDAVNSGGNVPTNLTPAQQQALDADNAAFKSFCINVADTRIEQAIIMFVPGLIIGGAGVVLSVARPRWLQD